MGDKPFLKPFGKWTIAGAMILVLGVGTAGVAWLVRKPSNPIADRVEAPLKKTEAIAALGKIEPAGQVIRVSGPTGERILRLLVKEGQQLKKGEPIAFLESYPELQAEAKLSASRLLEVQNRSISERRLGNPNGRNQAENRVEAQRSLVEQAEIAYQQAEKKFQEYEKLQKAGAVSRQDLQEQRVSLQRQEQQLKNERTALALLEDDPNNNPKNALIPVNRASRVGQPQIDLASAQSNLELAKARLSRAVIRAPQTGQILKVLLREGEAIPAVASQDNKVQPAIVEMGNTRQMYVVANVDERDINKVQIGQSAKISSPAMKGEIEGTVDKIGLQIGKNNAANTTPNTNGDTRAVEVKIRLHNSIAVSGLTNLQVNVAIQPLT